MRNRNLLVFGLIAIFFFSKAEAKKSASSKDYNDALGFIKANGIEIKNVRVNQKNMIWYMDCASDEGDEGDKETALLFQAVVQDRTKFKDVTLEKGSTIHFCNNKVTRIWTAPSAKDKTIEKDGYSCEQEIILNKNGQLCRCRLSKETEINGFMVPKATEIFLKEGKFFAALLSTDLNRHTEIHENGHYKLENGKPVKLNVDDSIWCLNPNE